MVDQIIFQGSFQPWRYCLPRNMLAGWKHLTEGALILVWFPMTNNMSVEHGPAAPAWLGAHACSLSGSAFLLLVHVFGKQPINAHGAPKDAPDNHIYN